MKDKKATDIKKLTVEIPMETFLKMDKYCHRYIPRRTFYNRFIKQAIEYYIDNHL